MSKPIVVGAVIYDPKVTVIWKIIRDFFEERRCPIEVSFFANYALQVDGLLEGKIDIAWNSPLAWLDAQRLAKGTCRAIAMRDTDRDRVSHFVTRASGAIKTAADLRGRAVAFGAKDSPQATIIPIEWLRAASLEDGAYKAKRFDVKVGLHGDHVGGELEAFQSLARGEVDASVMLDFNWDRWSKDGTINAAEYSIVGTTDRFDHCNFTVCKDFVKARQDAFLEALFSMSYENPTHREMMDMEGLRRWEPGRTSGYGPLGRAVDHQRYFEAAR